eukprot:836383-Amphidinium_carterae.1
MLEDWYILYLRQTASTTPTAGRRDILSASTRHMAPPVTTPPAAATAKKDALGGSTRNRPRVVGGATELGFPPLLRRK